MSEHETYRPDPFDPRSRLSSVKWTCRSLLALALAMAGVFFFQCFAARRPPEHQGRNLDEWLAGVRFVGDETTDGNPTVAAVRSMGMAGVPRYLEMLHPRESPLVRAHAWMAKRVRWIRPPGEPDDYRDRAIAAFGFLGDVAEPAIPSLVPMLSDPNTSMGAAASLAQIGPRGFEALASELKRGSLPDEAMWHVLYWLTWMDDPRRPGLVADVVPYLDSGSETLRVYAAAFLNKVDEEFPAAVPMTGRR